MKRLRVLAVALVATASLFGVVSASGDPSQAPQGRKAQQPVPTSGVAEFNESLGLGITECPQARLVKVFPDPFERRRKDLVEQYSSGGNDLRMNEEFTCFPQNETSIDTNPAPGKQRNVVGGANDYRNGFPMTGFYASMDNGDHWYGGIIPWTTAPRGQQLTSGGDPAVVFDRQGIVYMAQLTFTIESDTNAITVSRSTNGGYTWSRPCVPIATASQEDPPDASACGGTGDARQPGDGVVVFDDDLDGTGPMSVPFNDKEYIAAGPRPAGVDPVCFAPITRTPIPAGSPGCPNERIGSDRLYVTWSRFEENAAAPLGITVIIYLSYSDDRGKSWSPRRAISGSAPFCIFGTGTPNDCDLNQFSVPTVNPHTGLLGVAFQNFNTPDENQYLFVRSRDGGNTFEGPFFVTPVFDVNFPRAGAPPFGNRPDCTTRGQQTGRIVYTNSCFRSNSGGNVVADKRGGVFADDFYLVMSDNRNGTATSSNADVFLFKSLDGGTTWIGPTRVNNDPSVAPPDRDCPPVIVTDPGPPPTFEPNPECPATAVFGNDQWWPWVDINEQGHLNVIFNDRRLDRNSTAHEWPTTRAVGRPGNYLVWLWGAQCEVLVSNATACLAPGAEAIPQPTAPIDPGAGPVPGQGPTFVGPLRNFGVSDFPSNYDYSFRAGIFAGDYNNVAVTHDDTKAYATWTDARNGRSSRQQAGRNPACEQSDPMVDEYSSMGSTPGQDLARKEDAMFAVTECPAEAIDE